MPIVKVAIDIRRMTEFGVGTYIRNVVRTLARLDRESKYFLIVLPAKVAECELLPPNFHAVPLAGTDITLKGNLEFRAIVCRLNSGYSQPARISQTMPLYEYQCTKCGHRFEKIQKFSDKLLNKCPECGGALEQLVSAPAVRFKGSGWYVTDYAKKGAAHASSSEGDAGSKDAKGTKEAKKEEKPKADSSHKKHKKD
jgi:putative FmdB family regulatory protein